jgi:hypothetical protein
MDTKNQYKELSSNLIKDVLKVMKEGTKPKTKKEKELAAMAPPEDEITRGDVVKARIASGKTKVTEAVEVKRHSTNEPNVSKRTITYVVYKDNKPVKTFNDVDSALAHKEKLEEGTLPKRSTTQAAERHKHHKEQVLKHLKTLEELVKRHGMSSPQRPLNWGHVGDMSHINQTLSGLVDSFGQRSDQIEQMNKLSEAKVDGVAAGSLPNDGHLCASKIMHEEWGEGTPIYSQHAEPNADGTIDWYDVMFEHGIEKNVPSSSFEVLVSESHMNHKKKKMKEEVEQVDEIFGLSKKERYAKKRTELAKKIVAGNPEARAQRMQAMRINKTGEKAVAPELVGRYADDGEDADESPKLSIAAQMRHAFDKNKRSQKGYTVTFDNGQKVPVPAAQAHVFLTTLSKLSRNADMRDKFLKQAGKSYEGFLKAIGGNE